MSESDELINKQAYRTFQVLNRNDQIDKQKVIDRLQCFQFYLSDLSGRLSKKGFKEEHIINWIFKNEIDRKDIETFYKVNIEAAKTSLKRIIQELAKKELNEVTQKLLIDFICDLKPYINQFDTTQDYSWLVRNTYTHITNFYFNLANNILWNGKPGTHSEEKKVLSSSAPFIIRQSLEYKIKRVLGVQYIRQNDSIHKTKLKYYFEAFQENINNYRLKGISIETIEKIHNWTHFYVHSGIRPEPWRTETALFYVNKLNFTGKTSNRNMSSVFASIEVKHENLMKIKEGTEKFFKDKLGDDITIKWENPEVAIIKSKNVNENDKRV